MAKILRKWTQCLVRKAASCRRLNVRFVAVDGKHLVEPCTAAAVAAR